MSVVCPAALYNILLYKAELTLKYSISVPLGLQSKQQPTFSMSKASDKPLTADLSAKPQALQSSGLSFF